MVVVLEKKKSPDLMTSWKGDTYTNFKNPQIEGMLLRAIAWAGHYPVDTLVNGTAPVRGGRGRRGQGGGDAPTAPDGRRGGQ